MENIRQAIERAKALDEVGAKQSSSDNSNASRPQSGLGLAHPTEPNLAITDLDHAWLESRRIVAHDNTDFRSRAFDMLRTQVLQSMDQKQWMVLAITSPTAGCGKTLTALNLALSIARQPERSVLLVDLDLQKPHVAKSLGLKSHEGVLSVLHGRSTLAGSVVHARVDRCRMLVLPAEAPTSHSSEWMASRAMNEMLQEIRRSFPSRIVIVDLPPLLSGDEVIALIPQVDCVLLVAAIGTSTVAEIKQCNRYLQSTDVVRVVVNKSEEPNTKYYYGYEPRG